MRFVPGYVSSPIAFVSFILGFVDVVDHSRFLPSLLSAELFTVSDGKGQKWWEEGGVAENQELRYACIDKGWE